MNTIRVQASNKKKNPSKLISQNIIYMLNFCCMNEMDAEIRNSTSYFVHYLLFHARDIPFLSLSLALFSPEWHAVNRLLVPDIWQTAWNPDGFCQIQMPFNLIVSVKCRRAFPSLLGNMTPSCLLIFLSICHDCSMNSPPPAASITVAFNKAVASSAAACCCGTAVDAQQQ